MAENESSKNTSSDEIDLGQLLKLIGNGFKKVGNIFLYAFLYLKKNMLVLIGLVVVGVLIGFLLTKIVDKKLKTETIVRPNFESKDYVYDVIDEIQANIYAKDTVFFSQMGIDINDLDGFKIEIAPITDPEEAKEDAEQDLMYLELLQGFKEESFAVDIMRSVLTQKSIVAHRITFTYIDAQNGGVIAQKMLDYINNNNYFKDVITAFRENAQLRIDQNTMLIGQIDNLVNNYSKTINNKQLEKAPGSVILENESALNISSLLTLKNRFVKEIEEKRMELSEQKNLLSVLNMGKTQRVRKPLFNNTFVIIPLVLVGLFFILSFIKFLNKKAAELQ